MKHAIHMTYNRLVAGSNPAGATKLNHKKHIVKPLIEAVFFASAFLSGGKVAVHFLPRTKPASC
jgi:hypothetical protein